MRNLDTPMAALVLTKVQPSERTVADRMDAPRLLGHIVTVEEPKDIKRPRRWVVFLRS